MCKPILYFVAGPNGSGKSTLIDSLLLLPECEGIPYVCPDSEALKLKEIANEAERNNIAWRLSRERREEYLEKGVSFINETVFSHVSQLEFLDKAKENGYQIISFFITLENSSKNIERVNKRVSEGGHGVDLTKIPTRYERCMSQLPNLLIKSDVCSVFDNTNEFEQVFYKENNIYWQLKQKAWVYNYIVEKLLEKNISISIKEK